VRRDPPDAQLVDFRLDHANASTGERDGSEIVAVSAAEVAPIPTVFLTNFGSDCDKRLRECDPRIPAEIVEKPTLNSPSAWVDVLRPALGPLTGLPPSERTEPLGVAVDQLNSNFFRLTPPSRRALEGQASEIMEIEATLETAAPLSSAWESCDADWMILQRIDDVILVTDRGRDSDLPNKALVYQSELELESPALIVGRPSTVEEITEDTVIDCSPGHPRDWRRYPVVRLLIGSEERDFHLDTGSAQSYISGKLLSDTTHVDIDSMDAKKTLKYDVNGQAHVLAELPITVPLHVTGPNGHAHLTASFQVIKDWQTAHINPVCLAGKCPGSRDGQCSRRLGLIGRDLLYELDGIWEFDPASGRFFPGSSSAPRFAQRALADN
jgi:hypothetical protein